MRVTGLEDLFCSKLPGYEECRDPKLSRLGREKTGVCVCGGGDLYVGELLTLWTDISYLLNRLLVTTGLPGSYLNVWQITEDSGE